MVAAQTGFSGGVVVEDYAVIGGQVGIGDKARIESRAVLGLGLRRADVEDRALGRDGLGHAGAAAAGSTWSSSRTWRACPDMRREVAELKRRLAELEAESLMLRRGGRTLAQYRQDLAWSRA